MIGDHVDISNALSEIDSQVFNNASTVYIMPLLTPDDFGKSKSSTTVAYLFQESKIKSHPSLIQKNKFIVHTPDLLTRYLDFINNKTGVLLLVDDFIGTGETATSLINYLVEELGVKKDKLFVLSLVVQQEGVLAVEALGIKIYYSVVRRRGITDNYVSPIKERHLATMAEIENLLKVKPQFRLGYRGSEALISLIRTPNNTFPVFWYEAKLKSGKKFTAPFPR